MQIPAEIVEKAKAAYSEALQDPHRDVVEFDSMIVAALDAVAADLACWRLNQALAGEDSMAWVLSTYQGELPTNEPSSVAERYDALDARYPG